MRLLALALSSVVTFASCSSLLVDEDQYTGFLPDYSQLQATQSPSGAPVRRWMDPAVDISGYDSVLLHPVVFYPAQKPTAAVPQETLSAITALFDQTLGRELAKSRPLVSTPGPRTLVIKPAITSVSTRNQGLRAYEYIPIALIVAGVSDMTGARDQDTILNVEIIVSDASSGKPVALAVRQLKGEELPNDSTKLTSRDFSKAFTAAAADAGMILKGAKR